MVKSINKQVPKDKLQNGLACENPKVASEPIWRKPLQSLAH